MNQIEEKLTEFIKKHIGGLDDTDLTAHTTLVSSGLMDSITTLQVVEFLEEEYKIEFKPHEVSEDNMDTIAKMVEFVEERM